LGTLGELTSEGVGVGMDAQPDLLEVVGTLGPCGGLADFLDGGQQQPMRMAMMAITTSSSMSVKAFRPPLRRRDLK